MPLNVIQRQLGHATSARLDYLRGIDTEEIIATVHGDPRWPNRCWCSSRRPRSRVSLRCHADIYDEVPLCRLAERSEPPASFDADEELPREDDVLLDTALHHAAAERVARARGLVRRERAVSGAGALMLAATASV